MVGQRDVGNGRDQIPTGVARQHRRTIAAALAPFGYEPEDEHHRLVAGDGENYWREVNDTALKNLSAWVPDLRIKGTKKHGQGYRITAEWRGVENANVSIHPEGIKDWGNDKSHTPIDVVMLATGVDLNSATNFLAERPQVGSQSVDDGFNVGAFIERNIRSNKAGSVISSKTSVAVNDNDPYNLLRFTSSRFNNDPPEIKYLVDKSIEHGIPEIIPAMGDTGKSFLMLELCRRDGFGERKSRSPYLRRSG